MVYVAMTLAMARIGTAGRPRLEVAIIDMQGMTGIPRMTYRHGTMEEGLERVTRVLKTAREYAVPRALVLMWGGGPLLPELKSAAGKDAAQIAKPNLSAFEEPEFRRWIAEQEIGQLVVAGYNQTICVSLTISDSLRQGIVPHTSEEILFCANESEAMIRRTRNFFMKRGKYYERVEGILDVIRAQASVVAL